MVNPLIVALDVADLDHADRLASSLRDHVGGFKVGLELLMGHGPIAIETIARHGPPVFADTKLHDIPNTVLKASRRVANAGARWLTVHASGGIEMVTAAHEGMGGKGVLAVTVLTSLDDSSLPDVGVTLGVDAQVRKLVQVAASAGAEGVVCSPNEATVVKSSNDELAVFTPGIRPTYVEHHDQKRVATPKEAVTAGADYIVVGRAITGAEDVIAASLAILTSIGQKTN